MDKRLTHALRLATTARRSKNGAQASAPNLGVIRKQSIAAKELKNALKKQTNNLRSESKQLEKSEIIMKLVTPFAKPEDNPDINHLDNIFIKTILNSMLAGEIEQPVAIQLINKHYSERVEDELRPYLQDPKMTRETFLPIQESLHKKYDKEIKYFIKMYTDKLPAQKRNRKQTRRKQKRT
jgi:hypothetical protein